MKEHTIRATVDSITPLTDTIVQLIITPDTYIAYEAGQYLKIILDNEAVCYSIANAPLGSHKYELHIRHSADTVCNHVLLQSIKEQGFVTIQLPFGTCSMSHLMPQRPIVFIAAGTGFAPIQAMIEQLLVSENTRPFELFWSARSQSDLYMNEKVSHWQTHVTLFNYISIVDNEKDMVDSILEHHKQDLYEWQMVISGPFEMAYKTRDVLLKHGVLADHIFSDAFSFE